MSISLNSDSFINKFPYIGIQGGEKLSEYIKLQGRDDVAFVSNASAQWQQKFHCTLNDAASVSADEVLNPFTTLSVFGSGGTQVMPDDAYLVNMKITIDVAPGAGKSWEFVARSDHQHVQTVVTISNTDTEAELLVDGATLNAMFLRRGDLLSFEIRPIGTPTAFTNCKTEVTIVPNTLGDRFIFTTKASEGNNFTPPEKHFLFGFTDSSSVGNTRFSPRVPVAGTYKNFTIYRTSPQSSAPANTISHYLMNDTDVTEQFMALEDDGTSGEEVSTGNYVYTTNNSFHVPANKFMSWEARGAATTVTRQCTVSLVFTPDNLDEMWYMLQSDTAVSTASPMYMAPHSPGIQTVTHANWNATQNDRKIIWPRTCTISNVSVNITPSPGGSGCNYRIKNLTTAQQIEVFLASGVGEVLDAAGTLSVTAGDELVAEAEYVSGGTARDVEWMIWKETLTTNPTAESPLSHFVLSSVMSNLSDTGFKATCMTTQPRNDVQLVVSTVGTKAGFEAAIVATGPMTATNLVEIERIYSPTNANINYCMPTVTGLTEDTTYYYSFKSNGVVDTDFIAGPFTTFLSAGTEVGATRTDRYLFASCSDSYDDQITNDEGLFPALDHAATLSNIRTFCHQGDFSYHNVAIDDKPFVRSEFLYQLMSSSYQNLCQKVPFVWTPSDHDVGPGDHNNTTANAEFFLPANYQAARDIFPMYPSAQDVINFTQGVATSFIDGKFGIIVLDTQCQRHPTENTMLGDGGVVTGDMPNYTTWDQVSWLESTLLSMKSSGVVLVQIVAGGAKSIAAGDGWGGDYLAEHKVIGDMLTDKTKNIPEVIWTEGDEHYAIASDGTADAWMNQFTTGTPGQYPVIVAAPIKDNISSGITGIAPTWNSVNKEANFTDKMGIGVIEVVKDTTIDHEYMYTFRPLSHDGTEVFNAAKSAFTRTVDFNLASSSLAHPGVSGTHNVVVDKTASLGPYKVTVTGTGTLVAGTDYTMATSFGETITSGSTMIGHPHAYETDIVITFLTATTGTIILTLSSIDSNSVLGTTTVHTVTLS